ncbi:MAG: GatB/YqeY domain-containing protein [Deltaproteobacteria bacterium]|nr:GatB/YqeY domain-containing protein [Deltaproteobacteria bacterium]MBW2047306.1 GatB/YqeY domain-containing protein [Deltaproteobacteria bacterium]MBW2110024.1 GatB/YqeY domain-containing protein [Deltaproteobacteria bacterium]MBW2353333.1 GatB/YqeY domain-containing protein [Deltaproteobacteria bacterium]
MSLKQRIAEDLKQAMKTKDTLRLSCLRMVRTSSKNQEVEKGRELTDEEVQSLVSSMIRKGKEAAGEFRKGGREDLALKEEQEIQILYQYLPQQLTPEKIEETVREVMAEVSAEGPRDMGKVMKAAMARMAGKAQGKEVSEIARRLLTS